MSEVVRDLLIVGLALMTSTIGSIGGLGGAILLVPLLTLGDMTIAEAAPLGLVSVIAGSVAAGRRLRALHRQPLALPVGTGGLSHARAAPLHLPPRR